MFKKTVTTEARRKLAEYAQQAHGLSERQACCVLNLSRTVYRYQAKKVDDHLLAQALLSLAERQPRWGIGKMAAYFKQQGYPWNRKRLHRNYRVLVLNLWVKPKKRLPARTPRPLVVPATANHT